MKLLTVNMCTEVGKIYERMEALGMLIREKRPEFVALQNVTHDVVKSVKATWGARYNITLPPTKYETRGKPSVAILSTYPVHKSANVRYKRTTSNKTFFRCSFFMYDKQKRPHLIDLCTTQLESGADMSEVREMQINEALLAQTENEDCFALGDFSLLSDIDGSLHLNGTWKDVWLEIRGESAKGGDTYVPASNPFLRHSTEPSGRPDRILYTTRRYKLESVEVVGKEPFCTVSGEAVHVSSHFAVMATFTLLDPSSFLPPQEPLDVVCFFKRAQWSLSLEEQQ